MVSAAFSRFHYSFFEDVYSARDGLDTAALAALAGEERTLAEDQLIAGLPDTRAVIGLGLLRSRRAEPEIRRLFEAERRQLREAKAASNRFLPSGLVYVAKALWRIGPDQAALAAIIDVLASSGEWTQRSTAAQALFGIDDPAAERALIAALDDEESLVRHHAARGVLAIHGLSVQSFDPQHMMYRVMSEETARREGGKRDILAAIQARKADPQSGAQ